MPRNMHHRHYKSLVKARRWQRSGPGDAVAGLCSGGADREGSTLLIVMVLLGMLSLVGFLFYTFAAQERSTATYFADSQKVYAADLDTDALFDYGLEQLIVGPNNSLQQSALYGSRHSMLPNLFGRDIHPYNSAGIHLTTNPLVNPGFPIVDANFDGVADNPADPTTPYGQEALEINDSSVATINNATVPSATFYANPGQYPRNLFDPSNTTNPNPYVPMPDPGVDYTYPDINNLFLAYKGYAVDQFGNTVQVIIPSFHRPQLLRTNNGLPSATWYQDANFARRILRPHPEHVNPNGSKRFPDSSNLPANITTAFPFMQGTNGNQGVWSLNGGFTYGTTTVPAYEYDVDNDGDTIKEGVWLDLQYPIQMTTGGQKFATLFSFTVYDADGLFNLNVHGNHAMIAQLPNGAVSDIPNLQRFLSMSNQGVTPSEVNPQYAFYTDPSLYGGSLAAYQSEFGVPPGTALQGANMDWYRLLTGSANFQNSGQFNDLYAGRYGEANTVLYTGLMNGINNGGASATSVYQRPFPGITGADDNWNQYEGQAAWELNSGMPGYFMNPNLYTQMYNSSFSPKFFYGSFPFYASYPYGQPLDFNGDGTIAQLGTTSYGKTRLTTNQAQTFLTNMQFPQYVNYDNAGGLATTTVAGGSDNTNTSTVDAGWRPDSLQGNQMVNYSAQPYFPTLYGAGPAPSAQVDEATELISDPASASSADGLYAVDEMASLQMSSADRSGLSLSSRVQTLAPWSFLPPPNGNPRADSFTPTGFTTPVDGIARRFTTLSFDRKQWGYSGTSYHRTWEFSDLNGDGISETFPPVLFDATNGIYLQSTNANLPLTVRAFDPFRAPVRKLLELTVGNTTDFTKKQFRLSINQLTTTDQANDYSGNLIQRAITPHDPVLSNAPAAGTSPQEVQARLDRQQMARDIYVMLYMLGGGLDSVSQNGYQGNPINATPPNTGYFSDNAPDGSGNRNLYTDRQLREMAQFAVNVVDALDADHVMTKFEYDKNLTNGWGYYTGDVTTSILLDDNPYTPNPSNPHGDEYGDGETAASYTNTATNMGISPTLITPYRILGSVKYDPTYPEDSEERGVVYGVEAQEMTFSEVMAFQCPQIKQAGIPYNHPATEHDDSKVRYFTYLELRNISPNNIHFSNQQWRVRVVPANNLGVALSKERYVKFTGGVVSAGTLFTVGNAGETDASVPQSPNHSKFRCDNTKFDVPTTGAPFVATDQKAWIAPPVNAGSVANGGELSLDLLANRDQMGTFKFRLIDPGTTATNVTDDTDITNGATGTDGAGRFYDNDMLFDPNAPLNERPTFILERRQYPDRPYPAYNDQSQNDDNPWVPVDQWTLLQGVAKFGLQDTDTTRAAYDTNLQALQSKERNEPLDNTTVVYNVPTNTDGVRAASAFTSNNSLMGENSRLTQGGTFTYWQTIYDRPLASPVELFSIPLFGPQNVTNWTTLAYQTPLNQLSKLSSQYGTLSGAVATTPNGTGKLISVPYAATASGKILQPQDFSNMKLPPGSGPGFKVPAADNRWYRLFELFEVPTRTHRQLGNPLSVVRSPGKINLNGLRHIDVLAGLLDESGWPAVSDNVMGLGYLATGRPVLASNEPGDQDPFMPPSLQNPNAPAYVPNTRDWWVQFLKARDGRRTISTSGTDVDSNNNPIVRMYPDNVTGLYLPGLADSSPFRSFAALGFTRSAGVFEAPETALDQTLFRRLPFDMGQEFDSGATSTVPTNLPHQANGGDPSSDTSFNQRHLWEVGTDGEHRNDSVDPAMRNRILSKIYNNTTTRSHVFIVFMTVQYFEADDTNGSQNVQIGGPLPTPPIRGFFVIDRSKPEDAYNVATGQFNNYRSLIKYRLRIQ